MTQNSVRPMFIVVALAAFLAGCSTSPAVSTTSAEVARSRSLCAQASQIPTLSVSSALALGYYATQDANLACAETALNHARRLEPRNAYVALNLGVMHQRAGRVAQARAAYQEAIDLDRDGKSDVAAVSNRPDALQNAPGLIARRNLTNLR